MVIFLINLQVRTAQVNKDAFCLFVLQTIVREQFSQNFVKFLSVCLVKNELNLLLLFLFLFIFFNLLIANLLNLFLHILSINLFLLLFLIAIFLVNQLDKASENNDDVRNMLWVS